MLYSVPGVYIEKIERINNLAQRYDPGTMYQELLISNYDYGQDEPPGFPDPDEEEDQEYGGMAINM